LYGRLLWIRAHRARIEPVLRELLEQPEIDGMFARLNEVLDAVVAGGIRVL
jgi:hypothetical protein